MDTLTHEYYIGPFSYSEGFSVCHLNIQTNIDKPIAEEAKYYLLHI